MAQFALSLEGSVKISVTDFMSRETFAHILFDILVIFRSVVNDLFIMLFYLFDSVCYIIFL